MNRFILRVSFALLLGSMAWTFLPGVDEERDSRVATSQKSDRQQLRTVMAPEGEARASAHRCGSDCDHHSKRGEVRALLNPAVMEEFGTVEVGEAVRLEAGDRAWTAELTDRRVREDGRTVVNAKTLDGGILFLVADDSGMGRSLGLCQSHRGLALAGRGRAIRNRVAGYSGNPVFHRERTDCRQLEFRRYRRRVQLRRQSARRPGWSSRRARRFSTACPARMV